MYNEKTTDLPCWDHECGGRSSAAFYPAKDETEEDCFHCFKCLKQLWPSSPDYEEHYINTMTHHHAHTKQFSTVPQSPAKGLFPMRGLVSALDDRGIKIEVAERYGVETVFKDEEAIGRSFPGNDINGNFVAQKIKPFDKDRRVTWLGEHSSALMFGRKQCQAGGKYLTITEGEEDCLAAYQMLKEASPTFEPNVMSVKDGAAAAEKDCKRDYEFINSFENIIICFDGDDVGKKAAEKVAQLFPLKAKIVNFNEASFDEKEDKWYLKDSNDYLKSRKEKDFIRLWWGAEKYKPQGVLSMKDLWSDMTEKDNHITVSYPWQGLNDKLYGMRSGEMVVIKAPPKIGKCFGKDTPVRMWDGTIKMVQDVLPGDLLMGDDSTPRTVMSITRGVEEMFEIKQTKRDSYTVNRSHILCVKSTDTKEKIDINLTDYLGRKDRVRWKGYSEPILRAEEFDLKGLTPYILGVWLGDGHENAAEFSNIDLEVIEAISDYAKSLGTSIKFKDAVTFKITWPIWNKNPLRNSLKELGILKNKRVPKEFVIAPIQWRLDLLAGLMDSDGHLSNQDVNNGGFEITQKRKDLAEDILDLARSCGFKATIAEVEKCCPYKGVKVCGTYYRVNISGAIEKIPCKIARKKPKIAPSRRRDPSVCGLTIKSIGEGNYYGFVIDGNHRFLLKDGTVVHNTLICRHLAYHIRKTSDYNVGVIFLEDTRKSIGLGFCALEMGKPIQIPDVPYSLEDLKKAHDILSEGERITIFDPQDERTAENIFKKILYFVKAHDCKFIFLDHASMLAYSSGDFDERKFLDKLFADLKGLTTSLNIHLTVVVHVNDDGKTRGSRAPVQLCNALLSLERDKLSEDEVAKNTTDVVVEENRISGDSGLACKLFYDRDTGLLTELDLDKIIQEKQTLDKKTAMSGDLFD